MTNEMTEMFFHMSYNEHESHFQLTEIVYPYDRDWFVDQNVSHIPNIRTVVLYDEYFEYVSKELFSSTISQINE